MKQKYPLVGLGAALLTVWLGRTPIYAELIKHINISAFIYEAVVWLIFIVSLILLISPALGFIFNCVKFLIKIGWKNFFPDQHYHISDCRLSDLDDIDKFAKKYFNDKASNIDQIRRLYELNPSIFSVVKNETESKIFGYICIIPLSKKGVKALQDRSFTSANPANEHISITENNAYALYIGAIVGDSKISGQAILIYLRSLISQAKNYRNAKSLYARATTRQGLDILNRTNFIPLFKDLSGLNEIYTRARK